MGIDYNVTWIVAVEHVSGNALTNVTVRKVIPEGLELIDVIVPEGTYYNGTLYQCMGKNQQNYVPEGTYYNETSGI